MTDASASTHLLAALLTLMRPLVRFLLARGIAFDSFVEVAKRAFIEVAEKDFGIPGKRQTDSRISVLTGLTRKEVARVRDETGRLFVVSDQRLNRAARVVSGWVRDFAPTKKAKAVNMTLALDGGKRSFSELVRRYSGDMPVQSVLDELLRAGTVTRGADGAVQLVSRAYLASKDAASKVLLLGNDARDLIATLTHNLDATPETAFFQRKTSYDNLPASTLDEVRDLLREDGQVFLERFDRLLAAKDRDLNAAVSGDGRKRAVIGLYYFEEDMAPGVSGKIDGAKRRATKRAGKNDESV